VDGTTHASTLPKEDKKQREKNVTGEIYLILGGGGLVGLQIARRIANDLAPNKIIIASLFEEEVETAIHELQTMFAEKDIQFEGIWGDVFVRCEFSDQPRWKLLESHEIRETLYNDLFGPLEHIYEHSRLVELILSHKPDVIVDAINTATAISYQDVYKASIIAKRETDRMIESIEAGNPDHGAIIERSEPAIETLLLSQAVPQLTRHVLLLNQAMREVGTRLYLKIGTTGTGGMGLNIPYTHSEDKPSARLMTKSAIAFAHTGLLFLMARTPGGPIVKEIKPGAMIGYADISSHTIHEAGNPVRIFSCRTDMMNEVLELKLEEELFEGLGELQLPVIDTGENGRFTRGEFEAITALRQMEFMTPEDIAMEALLEIKGSNTGHDVIAAIDGAVMDPTYRAGYLRRRALDEIELLEERTNTYSVALGQLGPPELSKLLWEAELLRILYSTLAGVIEHSSDEISKALETLVLEDENLRNTITSIGLPILMPDGGQLMRGPFIRIPEVPGATQVPITQGDIDRWAVKGWVDLRVQNVQIWLDRLQRLEDSRKRLRGSGSAAITREGYWTENIRSGAIVGWIFNNEQEGYRIK
jgi:hypothetical protein